ncbi:unnamed protein product [Arctogadus glacialis]
MRTWDSHKWCTHVSIAAPFWLRQAKTQGVMRSQQEPWLCMGKASSNYTTGFLLSSCTTAVLLHVITCPFLRFPHSFTVTTLGPDLGVKFNAQTLTYSPTHTHTHTHTHTLNHSLTLSLTPPPPRSSLEVLVKLGFSSWMVNGTTLNRWQELRQGLAS